MTTPQELRERFKEYSKQYINPSNIPALDKEMDRWVDFWADWWLDRFSSLSSQLIEALKGFDVVEVPVKEHECHIYCCGKCWCQDEKGLVKLADVLTLVKERFNLEKE